MTVYELRKELEKWPQDSRVICCLATEGTCWMEELQLSDLAAGLDAKTLVLGR